jgi:sortase A
VLSPILKQSCRKLTKNASSNRAWRFLRRRVLPRLEVVSRLEVPRLGMMVMVHGGVQSGILRIGAGHVPGTASPGDGGNVVIAAHRDKFFPRASQNPSGRHYSPQHAACYRYSVEWTRVVKPSDRTVLAPSEEAVLTLYPFYYVGPAPDRFIVRARVIKLKNTCLADFICPRYF